MGGWGGERVVVEWDGVAEVEREEMVDGSGSVGWRRGRVRRVGSMLGVRFWDSDIAEDRDAHGCGWMGGEVWSRGRHGFFGVEGSPCGEERWSMGSYDICVMCWMSGSAGE